MTQFLIAAETIRYHKSNPLYNKTGWIMRAICKNGTETGQTPRLKPNKHPYIYIYTHMNSQMNCPTIFHNTSTQLSRTTLHMS